MWNKIAQLLKLIMDSYIEKSDAAEIVRTSVEISNFETQRGMVEEITSFLRENEGCLTEPPTNPTERKVFYEAWLALKQKLDALEAPYKNFYDGRRLAGSIQDQPFLDFNLVLVNMGRFNEILTMLSRPRDQEIAKKQKHRERNPEITVNYGTAEEALDHSIHIRRVGMAFLLREAGQRVDSVIAEYSHSPNNSLLQH